MDEKLLYGSEVTLEELYILAGFGFEFVNRRRSYYKCNQRIKMNKNE